MVEVPGTDAIELPLSVLAVFDHRDSHLDRGVSVQPVFPSIARKSEKREAVRLAKRMV